MLNIDLVDFKKYFNSKFWKAFKEKVLFYSSEDLLNEEKGKIIENLWNEISQRKYYPSIPRHTIFKEKGN